MLIITYCLFTNLPVKAALAGRDWLYYGSAIAGALEVAAEIGLLVYLSIGSR